METKTKLVDDYLHAIESAPDHLIEVRRNPNQGLLTALFEGNHAIEIKGMPTLGGTYRPGDLATIVALWNELGHERKPDAFVWFVKRDDPELQGAVVDAGYEHGAISWCSVQPDGWVNIGALDADTQREMVRSTDTVFAFDGDSAVGDLWSMQCSILEVLASR